jgi:hypothetical protein
VRTVQTRTGSLGDQVPLLHHARACDLQVYSKNRRDRAAGGFTGGLSLLEGIAIDCPPFTGPPIGSTAVHVQGGGLAAGQPRDGSGTRRAAVAAFTS